MFSLKTWTTAGLGALLALGAVGCGAYEPEPEVPQYQYAEPAPRPMTAEELAAYQAAHPEEQQGEEVAIGEDDAQADEYQDTDPSALTEFKPALEGHGEWVDDSTYGTVLDDQRGDGDRALTTVTAAVQQAHVGVEFGAWSSAAAIDSTTAPSFLARTARNSRAIVRFTCSTSMCPTAQASASRIRSRAAKTL